MELTAPPRPPGAPWGALPAGSPVTGPRHAPAGPTSQVLTSAAWVLVFVAVGLRSDVPSAAVLPTIALVGGIALGLSFDLRAAFASVSGLVWALVTFAVLSFGWVFAYSQTGWEPPYALVPLISLVVFGADWRWVDRLRPATAVSGLGLVPLLERDLLPGLVLVLAWFGVAAAALWSLRVDTARSLPGPVPLSAAAAPAPASGRAAAGVVAAWALAAAAIFLIGLLAFSPDRPSPPDPTSDRWSMGGGAGGGGSGSGGGSGGFSGSLGGIDTDGDGLPDTGMDLDGDGVADVDLDGDGVADADVPYDVDGDGIPDQFADVDGDGIPDWSDADADGGSGDGSGQGGSGGTEPIDRDGASAPGALDADDPDDPDDGGSLGSTILAVVGGLLLLALVAAGGWALHRHLARRRALAARPWPIRLAERLDREGARRGRRRRRDEPVTAYADVLGGGVLADERLASVGAAVSTGLFAGAAPSDATGAWAAQVLDEAVAANPRPTWRDGLRRSPPQVRSDRGGRPTPGSAA